MYIHIQYISVYIHTQYILATGSKDGGISPSPKELHSAVPLQGWSLELSSLRLPPPPLNPRSLGMLGNFRYQQEVTLLMSMPWRFTSATRVCRCLQKSTIVLSPPEKSKTMILTVPPAFFKVSKWCVEDIDHWSLHSPGSSSGEPSCCWPVAAVLLQLELCQWD